MTKRVGEEEAGSPDRREASLRMLGPTVYAPTFLFSVGHGAVVPIVAIAAKDLGASVAFAGFVVGLGGIGQMLFDIPAGALVARLGERRAMAIGTGALLVSLVGCVLSRSPIPFAACMF